MLLCALSLCPANRTEPGLQLFCPTSFAQPYTSAKTCYPRIRTALHCSARFRPKLICWRGRENRLLPVIWI